MYMYIYIYIYVCIYIYIYICIYISTRGGGASHDGFGVLVRGPILMKLCALS